MINGIRARELIVGLALVGACNVGLGQDELEPDEATRLARAAEEFEARANVLTMFDRDGNVTGTVGERAVQLFPALSPDGTRIAVTIVDLIQETQDLWVIDVATAERTRITGYGHWDSEWAGTLVWSPDGSKLAYGASRDGQEVIYRAPADGAGEAELLYRHPGANLWLGDWSPDGRFLSVSTTDLAESFLYVLPMEGEGERDIIELLHEEARLMAGSFSPDGRSLVYRSEVTGVNEIYIRSLGEDAATRQLSEGGALFHVKGPWNDRDDQIYYVALGERLMAIGFDGSPLAGGVDLLPLFDIPPAIRPGPVHMSVSESAERFVIAVPHAPTLEQITIFDREGNVVQRLGEPGVWRNPTLSPDGSKVAVRAWMQATNHFDILSFDLETGTAVAVTVDEHADNWPVWSPDGRQLAYASQRDLFMRIYRKSADGTGEALEVHQYEPGGFLTLIDWSPDGNYLSFNDSCLGVLYIVPLDGDDERRVMEWLREDYQVAMARFSPDGRYIAYLSDQEEVDVFRLFIAPFDPSRPDGRVDGVDAFRVSNDNVRGMVTWRGDGRELYYLTSEWGVAAVDIDTEPELTASEPRTLFTLPGPLPGNPKQWKSVAPDGERFVFVTEIPMAIE